MKILTASFLLFLAGSAFSETNNVIAATNSVDVAEITPEKKERSWLAAPMVVGNPAFGNGAGVVGMLFFQTDKTSTNNPNSSITAVGIYSDTDSYILGAFAQTFWKQDTWRINAGIAHPKINNHLSIEGISEEVEFTTTIVALITRVDRRVWGNFFFGAKGLIVDQRYSDGNAAADIYFQQLEVENSTAGQLGVVGSYDSRDHTRYPRRGNQSELSWVAVPEAWGAPTSYSITEGFSNWYAPFFERQVLASRIYGRFTPEGTPFSGLSTLGRMSDLRGYTSGELVAENLIAAQTEYRAKITKKVGAVAFIGVSALYDGSVNGVTSDQIHPSGGIGLRYLLNAENKMNFRFDYAWGERGERGFYMSVGESF